MISKTITSAARKFLVGPGQKFVFFKTDEKKFIVPKTKKTDIYIHIPFCKSLCPYCPYNRILYKRELIPGYAKALLAEVGLYARRLGKIEIGSVYIGGGTPTNMVDDLGMVIDEIKKSFHVCGRIAIETTVADINRANIEKLRRYGIDSISVGVQSFEGKYLRILGRNYGTGQIKPALDLLNNAGFSNINIDLIFAFPGQTIAELTRDIEKAINTGVDQITTYPLFTFPYSPVGEFMKINKVTMPGFSKRRKFYGFIAASLTSAGFEMTSVWSFNRNSEENKYSSVTRQRYFGIGAGAASRFDDIFYFNTFSVAEYEKRLHQCQLPVAIQMEIRKKLADYYWLYWGLYDTSFTIEDYNQRKDWKMDVLLRFAKLFGLCRQNDSRIKLTAKGAFWIHLAQNYFVLDYINKVWTVMKKEPFPDKIEI